MMAYRAAGTGGDSVNRVREKSMKVQLCSNHERNPLLKLTFTVRTRVSVLILHTNAVTQIKVSFCF